MGVTSVIQLSFDDLKSIYKVLRDFDEEIEEKNRIKIEIGDFILDNICELDDLPGSSFGEMTIYYSNNDTNTVISLYLFPSNTRFNCKYKPDPKIQNPLLIQGAFENIKSLLEQRKQKKKFLRYFVSDSPISLIIGIVFFVIGGLTSALFVTFFGIVMFFFSIILMLIFYFSPKEKSSIDRKFEGKKESFFIRNKDKIILILITSIISLLSGIVLTLITQSLISP